MRGVRTAAALFLTGAGGLVLELVWARSLGLVLGLTVGSQALAVAFFLGGNGLGAVLASRLAPARRRPLLLAALLGVAAALVSWPLPLLFAYAAGPQAAGWFRGGGLPLLALFLAALVGGGVTPLALAGTVGFGRPGLAGLLWGINLVGALCGAALGGAWLVPGIGLQATGALGAAAYLGAGLLLLPGAGRAGPEPPPVADRDGSGLPLPAAAYAVLVGGMATLALELLLFRLLVLRTGAFTLSLAGITAAFLCALGLGSLLLPRLLAPLRAGSGAAFLLLAGGAAAMAAPHLFGLVESWLPWHRGGGPLGQIGRPFLLALLVGGPAALPLGALLPLLYARVRGERAAAAAWLTLAQAGGALAGAAALPLLVLPLLPGPSPFPWAGMAIGALAFLGLVPLQPRRIALACLVAGAGLLLLLFLPARRAAAVPPFRDSRGFRPGREVVACRHDAVTAAAAVYDRRVHAKLLFTDGFQAASLGEQGGYMRLLGHLPLLLHRAPRRVVLVAVGTGTTLESVALHEEVERIDAVEISPAVAALTECYPGPGPSPVDPGLAFRFRGDPRVRLHIEDGRRHLRELAADRRAGRRRGADVITQEPLLPYTPAALPFYTRDFYGIVRQALAPGGLFVQWVPLGSTPLAMTRELAATMAAAFPRVSLWVYHSSALLVAGEEMPRPDPERFAAAFRRPGLAEDLYRSGMGGGGDLLAGWVTDRLEPGKERILTDDLPFLEAFVRPRGRRILGWLPAALAWVSARRSEEAPDFVPPEFHAAQGLYLQARRQEALERIELQERGRPGGNLAGMLYLGALAKAPRHRQAWLASRRYRAWRAARLAEMGLVAGEHRQARELAAAAVDLQPDRAWHHLLLAAAQAGLDRRREASRELELAAWWWPGLYRWRLYREMRRSGMLAALDRDPVLRAKLAELERGWSGERLPPFRPRELVLLPGPGRGELALRLAAAFPAHFTGALLAGIERGGEGRRLALQAALGLADPLLATALFARLDTLGPAGRSQVVRLLSTTGCWPAERMAALGRDPVSRVRRALAAALGRCRREEALPVLAGLLEDPAGEVRRAAAAAVKVRLGTLAGYDPEAGPAARAEAAARIKELIALRREGRREKGR